MASTREERMQQRLRGAQRRQVKDVDFGLVFSAGPAPVQEATACRTTSQPDLPVQSPVKATPLSRGRGRPANASIQTTVHRAIDANISAKRRKLDTNEEPSSSVRSTRSRNLPPPDIYDIPADEPEQTAADDTNESVGRVQETQIVQFSTTPIVARVPPISSSIHQDVENIEGRGRTSDLQNTSSKDNVRSPRIVENAASATPRKRKRGHGTSTSAGPHKTQQRRQDKPDVDDVDDIDELSPEKLRRREKEPKVQRVEKVPEAGELVEEDSQELAESIDDQQAAAVLKKNREKRLHTSRAKSADVEETEVPPARIKRREKTSATSPVQQRQLKRAPSKSKPKAVKKSAKGPLRVGSPIPVPVYRLTKGPTYDEDIADADILNATISCAKRSGVNAIDVLSQVCHEIIGSSLETLNDGIESAEDRSTKREYKTKRDAVETFGGEIQLRLLEHTTNLEDTYTIEKRLRKAQRKKLALREDILRVRSERKKIAIRMDEIRIKHENEKHDAQERNALNTIMHDIELAIDRGKESQSDSAANVGIGMTGTDVLLKQLADKVSVKTSSGGTLKQIKVFNAFLERAALALEGIRNA